MSKIKILYLCTGNSCRSQMAEGFTNALRGDLFVAQSAGVAPGRVDPLAVAVMAESGVDISGQRSKDVEQFIGQSWDWVVTLCDNARESCPFFPGPARRVHRGFDDPPFLAQSAKNEDEALAIYRRVRDEIKAMVLGLPGSLQD
ncbi:Protein-tyrosine phosphatase, low molecular weight [Desulfarculus baarsii DSM 2075]|uniref:Protein-tyrosine phosphatase, low molecular weight n=1 Tax=Desulfarculus baarsii (strain ATCC 33931 / DSM 2075 / LMG 7858 / VKM B-1802 / 2st14) TaxID=644282 RepID=E1QKA8_DESB2|nr:arsenate reductase ArsC [Desulfarculus baarsii]ADK86001.1 Protein-tyrosine phosphatase, low molecular weight [Desulfarculus baarsii DSM 2075]